MANEGESPPHPLRRAGDTNYELRRASDSPQPTRRDEDTTPIRASSLSLTMRELSAVLGGLIGVVGVAFYVYSNIIQVQTRQENFEKNFEKHIALNVKNQEAQAKALEKHLQSNQEVWETLSAENGQQSQSISRLWGSLSSLRQQVGRLREDYKNYESDQKND